MRLHNILVTVVLLCLLTGCIVQEDARNIDVLFDVTERSASEFNMKDLARALFHLGGLEKNKVSHHEVWITLTPISDLSTNSSFGGCLPKDEGILNRSTGRRLKEIAQFEDTIYHVFNALVESIDTFERHQSQVFRSIQQGLIKLESRTGQKYLLVFSDLLHFTDNFSFYTLDKVSSNLTTAVYDSIYSSLSLRYPIPKDLSDITVIVIHQPVLKTDDAYETAKWWWKKLIQTRAGRIEFYSTVEDLIYSFDPKHYAL